MFYDAQVKSVKHTVLVSFGHSLDMIVFKIDYRWDIEDG